MRDAHVGVNLPGCVYLLLVRCSLPVCCEGLEPLGSPLIHYFIPSCAFNASNPCVGRCLVYACYILLVERYYAHVAHSQSQSAFSPSPRDPWGDVPADFWPFQPSRHLPSASLPSARVPPTGPPCRTCHLAALTSLCSPPTTAIPRLPCPLCRPLLHGAVAWQCGQSWCLRCCQCSSSSSLRYWRCILLNQTIPPYHPLCTASATTVRIVSGIVWIVSALLAPLLSRRSMHSMRCSLTHNAGWRCLRPAAASSPSSLHCASQCCGSMLHELQPGNGHLIALMGISSH